MEKKILFEALNKELNKEDLELDLICTGGYVLEYYGFRTTKDVDAMVK